MTNGPEASAPPDAGSASMPSSDEEGSSPEPQIDGWFYAIRRAFGLGARTEAVVAKAVSVEDADPRQARLVANVRRLGEMRVSDAMVPRADVIAVEADASYDQVVEAFRADGHSRLPVYKETLDDALGFIHVKDVVLAGDAAGSARGSFSTRHHIRRVLTVPPSMYCVVLLEKMQAERVHMAMVIDEYGGVDGLVTIEDLLELIVGEIEDEHDSSDEAHWTRQGDGVYLADARAYLDEFEREIGFALNETENDDIDTLGGFIFTLCNRVPARGEVIQHPDGHEFEILDADPRRIKQVLVTLRRIPSHGEDTASGDSSVVYIEAAQ